MYVASITPKNYLNFIVFVIKVYVKKFLLVEKKNARRTNYTIVSLIQYIY